jgi:hypothetical protein
MAHLHRFCYWPQMKAVITKYVKGSVMCSISKPTNRKLGLYSPLPVPSHPWERISMDFLGGLPMTRGGHDYLYVGHLYKNSTLQRRKIWYSELQTIN